MGILRSDRDATKLPPLGRATRHGRARGAGSGWFVSILLHGGLLFAASRALQIDPVPDIAEASESPLVLDLRTQTAPSSGPAHFFEARAMERSGVPDLRAAPVLALKEPLQAVFASEPEVERLHPAHGNSVASAAPGGFSVATSRVGRPRVAALIAGGPGLATATIDTNQESGYLDLAPADTAPVLLAGKQPEYPSASRRAGEEGDVQCRLRIDAGGAVSAVDVLVSSSISRLDEAARAALLAWRFEPATHAGLRCACTLDHAVRFRLR